MARGVGARRFTPASIRTAARTSASCAPAPMKSSASTNARCSAPKWRARSRRRARSRANCAASTNRSTSRRPRRLNGLDFDLRGSGPLEAVERRKLARAAEALDLARVSNHGEIVIERRAPHVAFGEARVILPPGGFLQATIAGEEALANGAAAALAGARRVADLFCGAGAFALRLAVAHEIFAVDSDAAAIHALQRARGEARGLRAIEAVARDLFQRPLRPDELDRFDAVLFDPPRAGALAQARALGESRVPVVVAISCNVDSFARDARMLIDGGYASNPSRRLTSSAFHPISKSSQCFGVRARRRRPKGVLG